MRHAVSFCLLIMCSSLCAQEFDEQSFSLVNSAYDEQNPILSPDGTTLYFTVSNHPANVGGKKDPGDIWFARLNGNAWSQPVHGGSEINNGAYNAVAGISVDGRQLFLHGHYDPSKGIPRTQGISVSNHSGSGWSRPTNINIPYFMTKSTVLNGYISPDNTLFVFSAETYGTHGVEDLYVSFNDAGKWTEPKNLGRMINTQFQELCPSLNHDGTMLYFSSNGRKGAGSFDVYSAQRLDDSWTNWSEPKNLGIEINTHGRDLYYRNYEDRQFAFFTSTINSDGYGDIKFCRVKEPEEKDSTIVLVNSPDTATVLASNRDSIPAEVRISPDTSVVKTQPDDLIVIYGKVLNAKTEEIITAILKIRSTDDEVQTISAAPAGYSVSLPNAAKYNVQVEANGFVSTLEHLDIESGELKELEMNFKLQPVEIGTKVNLKDVLFAQTKADILPESYPELDMVVNFLKSNPTVRIELSGHTDNRGIHSDNVKLSHQRVTKVKEYLVEQGIDSKRITGKGYGGTRPIASNDTEESRRMNRRVEFTIKKF
jgi:OmpA-OmpF porin, OOP family